MKDLTQSQALQHQIETLDARIHDATKLRSKLKLEQQAICPHPAVTKPPFQFCKLCGKWVDVAAGAKT
jgi:hypothetical protein